MVPFPVSIAALDRCHDPVELILIGAADIVLEVPAYEMFVDKMGDEDKEDYGDEGKEKLIPHQASR
jgi:hypothetical protein